MESYTAKQRFFHKAQLVRPGETIELNNAEAARLSYLGFIQSAPQQKPKRVLKRKKDARFTD